MIQTCKIVHFQRGNEKISPLWSSTMKRLSITWNIDLYCVPGQCFFHIIFILVDFNVGNLLLVWFFSKKCCSPVRNFVTRHWLGPGGRRNLMEDMSKLPTRDFDQFWKREQQAWCAWLFGGVRMGWAFLWGRNFQPRSHTYVTNEKFALKNNIMHSHQTLL